MKEELQGKLVEILTSIQSAAGKASDSAVEQLPDIAQSYIAYGRVWSLVALALCVTVFALGCRAVRWSRANWSDDTPGPFFIGALGGVGVLVSSGLSFAAMQGAMLVWLAPKVWLLKEIAGLVK